MFVRFQVHIFFWGEGGGNCHGFALDLTEYLLNMKVLTLVTTCW